MFNPNDKIKPNSGNLNKILDTINDPNKDKKKKPGNDECFEESAEEATLEYFTE